MKDIYKYNSSAVTVLAAYKALGGEVNINRRLALASLRLLLSELTLAGDGNASSTCILTKALAEVVDINTLSAWDCICIFKTGHKLIGLSK